MVNQMVNLENIRKLEGVIEKVEVMPLREFFDDEERLNQFIEKMRIPDKVENESEYIEKRLNRDVIVITYTFNNGDKDITRREFLNIPLATGYSRSKLKAFVIRNDLPLNTDDWLNRKIKLTTNDEGFVRLV